MIKNFIKFQSLWYLVSSLLDRHMGRLNLNGSELNSEPSLIYVASNQNIQPDHMCSPCVRHVFAIGLAVERYPLSVTPGSPWLGS